MPMPSRAQISARASHIAGSSLTLVRLPLIRTLRLTKVLMVASVL